jgi:hypothetical protein
MQEHENQHQISYEELVKAQKISLRDVADHITGPVISVIAHIVLIALLSTVIVFRAPEEREGINAKIIDMEFKEIKKIPEPPKPPEEQIKDDFTPDIDTPDVNPQQQTDMDVDDVPFEEINTDIQPTNMIQITDNKSVLHMSQAYANRSGKGREDAIKKYNISRQAEEAVQKSLDWFVKHQNPDGSWGVRMDTRPAFTSLVVLSFFARGETPQSQKYGITMIKAIRKLCEWVDDMKRNRQKCIPGPTYTHAIVAYALSEAYGLTGTPRLKKAMNETVKIVVDGINNKGSFYYGYDKLLRLPYAQRNPVTGKLPADHKYTEAYSDLSFAGWNYQALKAAFAAGCEVPGLDKAIDNSVEGLKFHAAKGEIGGQRADFGMTCLGTLCLGLLGDGNSRAAKDGMKFIRDFNKFQLKKCSWKYNKDIHGGKFAKSFTFAIYTWYYQTQVLFQATKGTNAVWRRWYKAFSSAFVKEQEKDGHWSTPAQKYGQNIIDASKDNAEWTKVTQFKEELDLDIYSTALCCLTLQVYSRYLPTYKLTKPTRRATAVKDEEDDLGLIIR